MFYEKVNFPLNQIYYNLIISSGTLSKRILSDIIYYQSLQHWNIVTENIFT